MQPLFGELHIDPPTVIAGLFIIAWIKVYGWKGPFGNQTVRNVAGEVGTAAAHKFIKSFLK